MSPTIAVQIPAREVVSDAADLARPFLRRDTFYAEVDGGIQFASAGPAFHLNGRGSFQVFERIAPFLDGEVSRGELRAALGAAHWPTVDGILDHLADRGFLRWIGQDDVASIEDDARSDYAEQIAFLAQYTDTPHAAFAAFRDAPVHVVGEGVLGDSVRENLSVNGHRRLALIDADRPGPLSDSIRDAAHLLILPTAAAYTWFAKHRSELQASRCVLVLPAGDRLWVLPHAWRDTGSSQPDWKDAVIALEAAGAAPGFETMFAAAEEGFSPLCGRAASVQVQRMLGALLSYEVFKGLTGALPPETAVGAISLHVITGETAAHRVLPSTQRSRAALNAAAPLVATAALSLTPEDSRPDDYPRWRRLVGSTTMPLTGFADERLTQLPFKVAVATTSEGSVVRAASLWTLADARSEAIARGYEQLVSALEPPRPVLALTSLDDGTVKKVDAARVFRRSRANAAGRYERSAAAVAVAISATDATRRAIHKAVVEHLLVVNLAEPAGTKITPSGQNTVMAFLDDVSEASGGVEFVSLGAVSITGSTERIYVVIALALSAAGLRWHAAAAESEVAAAAAAATEVIAIPQFDDPLATTPSMQTWPGVDPRVFVVADAAPGPRAAQIFAASIHAPLVTAADLHAAAAVVAE